MSESECRMVVGFGERCGRAIHVLPVVSLPSLLEQRRQRSPFSGGPCIAVESASDRAAKCFALHRRYSDGVNAGTH